MDSAALRASVASWHRFLGRAQQALKPRHPVPKRSERNLGLAFVGVRRSGKTYTAIQLSMSRPLDQVLYYNFEDPLFLLDNDVAALDQLLLIAAEQQGAAPVQLILDEIQNVAGWERWVRKILDQKEHEVIITGSSAKLLSRELATSIAGRCLEQRIWPLSFREHMEFRDASATSPSELAAALSLYLRWGGFPETALIESADLRSRLLQQYLSDIVLKDVLQRANIRNHRALMQVVTFYLTNPSSTHSYTALKNAFGIGVDTAAEITQALTDAFVVFEVNRYHPNLKVQARDARKVYIIDTGLRNAGARSTQLDTGKLLENVVYIELLRRGREVSYYKGEREVDFVITEQFRPVAAIQVCAADLQASETAQREIGAIDECLQALGLREGTIITWDREDVVRMGERTIRMVPAWTWLLSQG